MALKNKCTLICHHVNPGGVPTRKAACQGQKRRYSNIVLESLHTSSITHMHSLPPPPPRLGADGQGWRAHEDVSCHHHHYLPCSLQGVLHPTHSAQQVTQMATHTTMYGEVAGNWAVDSGTFISSLLPELLVQLHHPSY